MHLIYHAALDDLHCVPFSKTSNLSAFQIHPRLASTALLCMQEEPGYIWATVISTVSSQLQ